MENENGKSEQRLEMGDETEHVSLLEPSRMVLLFGDAVAKNLLAGGERGRAIGAAKAWLKTLLARESDEARPGLRTQLRELHWNRTVHERLCYRLFNEASARGDAPERIAKIREALKRVQQLRAAERKQKLPQEAPQESSATAAVRPWLTPLKIGGMVHRSERLDVTYWHLCQRIMLHPVREERQELLSAMMDVIAALPRRRGPRLGTLDRTYLTRTTIDRMLHDTADDDLVFMEHILTVRITTAFESHDLERRNALLRVLKQRCETLPRIRAMLDTGAPCETLPRTPGKKPRRVTASPASPRHGLERFHAKWGPRSIKVAPSGVTVH